MFSKKIRTLFLLIFVASCSQFSSNKSVKERNAPTSPKNLSELSLNLDVKKKVLANGMKVLLVENRKLPIASFYTYFDVGGRYEYEGTTGATHFLEHMMFKRTKSFEPEYFSKFIESNGGQSNAYTTFDNTVYYESVPSHTIDTVLDLEKDRLINLILEPNDFEKERQVVLEERKMRYENSPKGQLYLKMMKSIFKGTPYGGSVIGSAADVKNLSREKMKEFYDTFYRPNNAIMIAVGDFDSDELMGKIEEKFGSIEASPKLTELKSKLDAQKKYQSKANLPTTNNLHGQSVTPLFSVSFPSVGVGTEEGYALDFLASIIGEGASSYLNKKFVSNKRPQLTNVFAANYTLKNSGVFFIQGQLLEKVSLNRFKRDLFKVLRKSCTDGVTKRNVQKTKNQLLVDYYNNVATNSGLASFLGANEFFYGDYKMYEKELQVYNSMTVEKVRKACNKFLDRNRSAFISVWKKHPKR